MTNHLLKGLGYCLIAALAIISSGCATGTTLLAVSHSPLETIEQKRQGDVLVKPFVDKRENKQYIGNKRNGFGMVLGHVATRKDVKLDELLTKYFVEALRDAGYNAVLDESAASGTAPKGKFDTIIEGEVVTFWMDLYMAVWHRVVVNVKATNPVDKKVLWEKTIEGSEKRVLWVGATGEYERIVREALTKALNQATQEFVSDDFYNSAISKTL